MTPRLPAGMTPAHERRLRKMREALADLVLERAALIYDGCPGISWADADADALISEGVDPVPMKGVTR